MLRLLDIAPINGPYRPRRRFWMDSIQPKIQRMDTAAVKTDTVDSTAVPSELLDSAASQPDVIDTLNNSQNIIGSGIGSNNDDSSMLLWAILVVLAALSLCLYMIYVYRRRLVGSKAC